MFIQICRLPGKRINAIFHSRVICKVMVMFLNTEQRCKRFKNKCFTIFFRHDCLYFPSYCYSSFIFSFKFNTIHVLSSASLESVSTFLFFSRQFKWPPFSVILIFFPGCHRRSVNTILNVWKKRKKLQGEDIRKRFLFICLIFSFVDQNVESLNPNTQSASNSSNERTHKRSQCQKKNLSPKCDSFHSNMHQMAIQSNRRTEASNSLKTKLEI